VTGIVDVIKKAFSWGLEKAETEGLPDQSEGINYDEIVAQLNIAKSEVERIKLKMSAEMSEYYERLVKALKAKDEESATFNASELAIKKKVYKIVAAYEKLLGAAIERIADARNIEVLVKTLAPLQYVMETANNYLSGLAPDVTASLASVIESTEGVIRKVGLLSSVLPEGKSVALYSQEVKELITEAMKEAAEEAEKAAPKVPPAYDPEALERESSFAISSTMSPTVLTSAINTARSSAVITILAVGLSSISLISASEVSMAVTVNDLLNEVFLS